MAKVIARKLIIHLADDEYGNELMNLVATAAFLEHPDIDLVTVYEHAGWWLTYTRDGTIVGTANDAAVLSQKAIDFIRSIEDVTVVQSIRRQKRVVVTC